MSVVVIRRRQERNDTAANWTAANPVLLNGEWAVESDTGRYKLGNGVTAWNDLVYAGEAGGATLPEPILADTVPGAGWPIAIDRATARGRIARADTYIRAFVVGFSTGAAAIDHPCPLTAGPLTLADWSGPAGTASLLPGLPYFLALTGGITATPPTGGQALAPLGMALTAQTLDINLHSPILL